MVKQNGVKMVLKELAKDYKLGLTLICIFNILSTFGILLVPYFVMKISTALSGDLDMGYMNNLLLLLIGVFFVQAIINFFSGYYTQKVGEQLVLNLKTKVFNKILNMPMTFFDANSAGELVSRLTNDVNSVKNIMVDHSLKFIKDSFLVIFILSVLLIMNPLLTLIILVAVLGIGVGSNLALNNIKTLSTKIQKKNSELTSYINESLINISIIKAFVREQYILNIFQTRLNDFWDYMLKRNKLISLIRPMVNLISYLLVITVFWFALRQVVNGQIDISDLLGYFSYTFILAASITTLTSSLGSIKKELGIIDELVTIYNAVPENTQLEVIENIHGDIVFNDVFFSYKEDEKQILNGINFRIIQGSTTAIVGPSGEGKSTIINLLLKNFTPDRGSITINGKDFKDINPQSLRNSIGVVLQNTYLFNTTIYENILFGRPEATENEVMEAAKAANIDEFVKKLPNGYNTNIGEMGNKISRGQAQRIALARVFLKNPDIIIMDEATASLDNINESKILSSINSFLKNRTIIIITHRLDSITEADNILFLSGGVISESGTHSQLLSDNGEYYNMYKSSLDEDHKVLTN